MKRQTVFIILLILGFQQFSLSKDPEKKSEIKKAPPPKDVIAILNFIPKGNSRKYTYYATVIPKTLTINLKNNPKYTIQRKYIELPLVTPDNKTLIDGYKAKFRKTVKNKGVDFIVIGTCQLGEFTQKEMDELSGKTTTTSEKDPSTNNPALKAEQDTNSKNTGSLEKLDDFGTINEAEEEDHDFTKKNSDSADKTPKVNPVDTKNSSPSPKSVKHDKNEKKYRMLFVRLQVIDLQTGKISDITKWSKEIGVLLKETTDDISDEIDNSVAQLISLRPKPKLLPDANTGLYSFLRPFSVGVKYGILYPQGDLADQYTGDDFSQIFLQLEITRNLAFSANYFNTEFDLYDSESGMNFYNSLNFYYLEANIMFWMNNYFNLSINAGAGYGLIKIATVNGNGPTSPIVTETRDFRPIFTGGIDFKLNVSSLQFILGISYQYMMTENLDEYSGLTTYAGAAFQFR